MLDPVRIRNDRAAIPKIRGHVVVDARAKSNSLDGLNDNLLHADGEARNGIVRIELPAQAGLRDNPARDLGAW